MNIAWFIVLLLLFIYGQGYLYTKRGLKKLTCKRRFNKQSVFVGQEITLIDEIVNQKLLPIPWIRLEAKMDRSIQIKGKSQFDSNDQDIHRTLFSLLPYQKLIRRHHLVCTKRGVFELDSTALTLGDIFGFAEEFSTFETDAKIIVYPKLLNKDQLSLPAQRYLGDQFVKHWLIKDPFMITGSRDYQAGDAIDQINWKTSARTKNIQVNVHDHTADRELVILVNADQSDDIWMPIKNETLFEQSISQAATVAHYLEENGESYGFATNAIDLREQGEKHRSFVKVEVDSGSMHFYYLLDQLAYLAPERSRHFKYLLDEYAETQIKRYDILLITPIVTPELLRQIEQLRATGHSVQIDHISGERMT